MIEFLIVMAAFCLGIITVSRIYGDAEARRRLAFIEARLQSMDYFACRIANLSSLDHGSAPLEQRLEAIGSYVHTLRAQIRWCKVEDTS